MVMTSSSNISVPSFQLFDTIFIDDLSIGMTNVTWHSSQHPPFDNLILVYIWINKVRRHCIDVDWEWIRKLERSENRAIVWQIITHKRKRWSVKSSEVLSPGRSIVFSRVEDWEEKCPEHQTVMILIRSLKLRIGLRGSDFQPSQEPENCRRTDEK
jgi:hypothetical protein